MDTVWILADQLSPEHSALNRYRPGEARVLMIESRARGAVLRYHQVKLALVYSAMRHFAAELSKSGWDVDYTRLEGGLTFETGFAWHLRRHQPERVLLAEPNSWFEQRALEKLAAKLRITLELVPTAQFLTPREDFRKWAAGKTRLLMENHYRRMRKRHGWLMREDGQPEGGAWNFDADNRATFAAWKRAGRPAAQHAPQVRPDPVTTEAIAMVKREFAENPGDAEKLWLPVTRKAALDWLERFIEERLPHFGSYEDMMAEGEPFLFHSVLSPMLNLGLLTPRECVEAAIEAYGRGAAPLNSVEGFVRQIIGWREFINGVYWLRGPEYRELNALGAEQPLPDWTYTGATRMNCLHQTLRQALDLGWNHHIQRLMVLGNFFLIAGINPQQALRWYSEMYVDAYDWVMAANVIGMSLYADGGFMATKPYAATSGYIRKMSNYCGGCHFDPDEKTGERACPFNYLYWDFIGRHSERLAELPRMRSVVAAWQGRSEKSRCEVQESAERFLSGGMGADDERQATLL